MCSPQLSFFIDVLYKGGMDLGIDVRITLLLLSNALISPILTVTRTRTSAWLKVLHWTTLPPNCLLRVPVNQRKAQRPWLVSWLHCQHPLVAWRGNTVGMDPQPSSTLLPNCIDLVGESLVSRTLMCFLQPFQRSLPYGWIFLCCDVFFTDEASSFQMAGVCSTRTVPADLLDIGDLECSLCMR